MRALALENLGELRKAISDLKPTVILRQDNREGYLKMSVLWYRLGDIEQSLELVFDLHYIMYKVMISELYYYLISYL